ncbi:methyltransferase domain-containing protein [uncultured Sunxiuqinia sp.]|uniref:class I SAM-dependent methyltransferase n=1 Tax=uncultured Sunxiuqinia sp. TaxID=1573825 RepID=UPI002AA91C3E|nr:methyltransferase domain-containing protein [uncultured Sunxiuqinia sp.]
MKAGSTRITTIDMKRLQQFFNKHTVKQVLDIGTGSGDFIKILNDTFQGEADITGVDPGEQWLKEARNNFPQENIRFQCMSGEKLAFDDHAFDVVSMANALHHLQDTTTTLSEMKRVIKPNGWIIICEISDGELNESQKNQQLLHHFKSFVDRLHGISHRETYTPDEINAIITQTQIDIRESFTHLKMKKPKFEEQILDEKYEQMKSLLEELQGRPEYETKKDQLPLFKQRLQKYGFQMAPQHVVIGRVENL